MKKFDCGDFETRIHDILDQRGSLSDDPELAQHRAECPECLRRYEEYLGLSRLLRISPSATDGTRSPARGRSIRPFASNRQSAHQPWWAATAAAMLVALFIGLQFGDRWMANRQSAAWLWQAASHRSVGGERLDHTPSWGNHQHAWLGLPADEESQAIAVQAQQWIDTIEGIPATLGELQPYCFYTASFTGVTTLTAPVSWTVDMLRRRWSNSSKPESPIRSDRSEWMSRHFRHV